MSAAEGRKDRRRLWIGLGIGGAVGAVLLLVCGAVWLAAPILRSFPGQRGAPVSPGIPPQAETAASWVEASERSDMVVFMPARRPGGEGDPALFTFEEGGTPNVVARYSDGLFIWQGTQGERPLPQSREVSVEGADEAWFDDLDGVTYLVLRRGDTWLNLSGLEDDALLDVARTLRPVRKEEE